MNLIDAIKSGRKYRMVGESVWINPRSYAGTFDIEGVLADWEIEEEEEKTVLTKQQLLDLYHLGVIHGMIQKGYNHREVYNDLYNMLTKLGYEGDL